MHRDKHARLYSREIAQRINNGTWEMKEWAWGFFLIFNASVLFEK